MLNLQRAQSIRGGNCRVFSAEEVFTLAQCHWVNFEFDSSTQNQKVTQCLCLMDNPVPTSPASRSNWDFG